jgi:predicted transcriptional regulator
MRVYDLLRERIVVSIPRAAEESGLTWPTVNGALRRLEHLGIAREVSGRNRARVYVYQRQLDLLNA